MSEENVEDRLRRKMRMPLQTDESRQNEVEPSTMERIRSWKQFVREQRIENDPDLLSEELTRQRLAIPTVEERLDRLQHPEDRLRVKMKMPFREVKEAY